MDKYSFIDLLHNFYRNDPFINDLFTAIAYVINNVSSAVDALKGELYFDTMVYMIPVYEAIMKITPLSSQSLDDRRTVIQARWLSMGHNDITLLQNIANIWKNGETVVTFVAGQILITFVGAYGIPTDLSSLLAAMDNIKPAHLPYNLAYKWILKKDVNNVMTKQHMQTLKKSNFARGSY